MRLFTLCVALSVLAGCAYDAEKAELRREIDHYNRQERMLAFDEFSSECRRAGGYPVIERRGHYSQQDVLRNIPGPDDIVYCRGR